MFRKLTTTFCKQGVRSFSTWANVPMSAPDPILGLSDAFKKDTSPQKVNLGVGAYRDDNGKPVTLECVRRALDLMHGQALDNEYLPVQGLQSFIDGSLRIAYGEDSKPLKDKRVAAIQCLSGTGGVRTGWDLCRKYLKEGTAVYMPNPTWPNHRSIATEINMPWKEYRYLNKETKGLDFNGMLSDLDSAPNGSIILLHVCSHNPTGVDPTKDQWSQIRDLVSKKNHIAFFDSAYQGFTTGDLVEDAYAVRFFQEKEDITMMLAQSFAKNFGLYGQRVGCLSTICASEQEAKQVQSQMKIIGRRTYSNPPLHGARIVSTVLNNPELYNIWLEDIRVMANRIIDMRQALKAGLIQNGSKLNWDHITDQIGMFAFTGVDLAATQRLINEFHIYLTADGRISIAGLNTKNVDYVAKAFDEVTK